MIFQITDDLLDRDCKTLDECNITNMLNEEQINRLLDQHTERSISALSKMKRPNIDLLKNLLFFLKNRTT